MVIVIISTVKPVPDNVTYHGQPQRGNVRHSPVFISEPLI